MTEKSHDSGRRRFLAAALPLGTMACLGCKGLLAFPGRDGRMFRPGQEKKFSENPGMTVEETFRFFYGTFIPVLQILARDIGKDTLVEELTKASAENGARMITQMAKDLPKKDIKTFASLMESMLNTTPYDKALTYETVEKSDKVFEVKFTQCLPAKIWREMKAADLGYALECSPSDAMIKAFNPRMKATDLKNTMKGDSVCIERFELI